MSATTGNRQVAEITQIKRTLEGMATQFRDALPSHITPERFQRVVMTVLNTNPGLMRADRTSLLTACMKCAADGLVPDGRDAALVEFGGKVQYMPMYAGILRRVRNSGEIANISAQVVYENDHFAYVLGDEERIEHKPQLGGSRGKMVAVYAIARFKDGTIQREVMTAEDVQKVRNSSRAKNSGPWTQWEDQMWRKTCLRRLSKFLPMDADVDQILRRDDDMETVEQPATVAHTIDGEIMDPFEAAAAGVEVQPIAAVRQDTSAPEAPAKTIDATPAEVDGQQDGLLDTPMDIAADLIGRMNGIKTNADLDRFLKHPKVGEAVAKFDNLPQVSGEWLRAIDARRKALSSSVAA